MPKKPIIIEGEGGQEYAKSKKSNRHLEETHVQKPIVRTLTKIEDFTGLLTFFHCPNQLLRKKALRIIFAALGVRAGVPDLCICLKNGVTIWLELKYGKNGASDKQDEFQAKLTALGHKVHTIAATDSQQANLMLFDLLAFYGLTDFKYVHPTERA